MSMDYWANIGVGVHVQELVPFLDMEKICKILDVEYKEGKDLYDLIELYDSESDFFESILPIKNLLYWDYGDEEMDSVLLYPIKYAWYMEEWEKNITKDGLYDMIAECLNGIATRDTRFLIEDIYDICMG